MTRADWDAVYAVPPMPADLKAEVDDLERELTAAGATYTDAGTLAVWTKSRRLPWRDDGGWYAAEFVVTVPRCRVAGPGVRLSHLLRLGRLTRKIVRRTVADRAAGWPTLRFVEPADEPLVVGGGG